MRTLLLTIACAVALLGCQTADPLGPRVEVDPSGYLRIDGELFFPLEIYGAATDEDFSIAEWMGLNTAIGGRPPIRQQSLVHGFKWISPHWFFEGFDAPEARRLVGERSAQPNLIAWNLNDEPDLRIDQAPPAVLGMASQLVRENDPFSRPTSVTLSGGSGGVRHWPDFARTVDILRIDPYPVISGRPLTLVLKRFRRAIEATGGNKPVWTVLQTWGPGRLPTARQHRALAYLAIVAGTRGLSHFDLNFRTWRGSPEFFNALQATVRELRTMVPVLLRGRPVLVTTPSTNVHLRALELDGTTYIWIVNPGPTAARCEIRLPPRPGVTGKRTVHAIFDDPLWADRPRGFLLEGSSFLLPMPAVSATFLAVRPGEPGPAPVNPLLKPKGPVQLVERFAPGHYLLKNTSDAPVEAGLALVTIPGLVAYELDIAGRPMGPVAFKPQDHVLKLDCRPQTFYEVGTLQLIATRRRAGLAAMMEAQRFGESAAARLRCIDVGRLRQTDRDEARREVYRQVLAAARELEAQGHPQADYWARQVRDLAHIIGGVSVRVAGVWELTSGWDAPALRQQCFPGADYKLTVQARPLGCVQPGPWRAACVDDVKLEPYASFRRLGKWQPSDAQHEYEVRLPEKVDLSRDHVMRVIVRYGTGDSENAIVRKLRFDIGPPFESRIDVWARAPLHAQADIMLTPRFPDHAFESLQLRTGRVPAGWTVSVPEPAAAAPDGRYHGSVLFHYPEALPGSTFQPTLEWVSKEKVLQTIALPRMTIDRKGRPFAGTRQGRQAVCVPTEAPPTIDGKLDEACWRAAPPAGGMMHVGTDAVAPVQTVARFAYDRQRLYVTAEVFGIDPKRIKARTVGRDRWPAGDDRISLALTPEPVGRGYYYLAVNAAGAIFDLHVDEHRVTGRLRSRLAWSPPVEVATQRTDTGWRLEAAIRLADLGVHHVDGQTRWRMNFRSSRSLAPRQTESWSYNLAWEPSPASFGILQFRPLAPTTRP